MEFCISYIPDILISCSSKNDKNPNISIGGFEVIIMIWKWEFKFFNIFTNAGDIDKAFFWIIDSKFIIIAFDIQLTCWIFM